MSASKSSASKTSENKRDYEVGRGKPLVHSRFKKGQSGNPRGPRPKNLPALLVDIGAGWPTGETLSRGATNP